MRLPHDHELQKSTGSRPKVYLCTVRLSMTLRVSLRNLLTNRVAIDDNQDEKWPRNLKFISEL